MAWSEREIREAQFWLCDAEQQTAHCPLCDATVEWLPLFSEPGTVRCEPCGVTLTYEDATFRQLTKDEKETRGHGDDESAGR